MSDEQLKNDYSGDGVGAQLKAIRLSKNLNIADFAKRSVIPEAKIHALEEGQYKKVGTETFVIGYIRKYATWLEADADALVNEYKSQIGENALPEVLVSTEQPLADTAPVKAAGGQKLKPVPAHVDHPEGQLVKKLKAIPAWSILAVLLVLWLLGAYVFVPSESEQKNETVSAQSVQAEPVGTREETEEAASSEVASPVPVEQGSATNVPVNVDNSMESVAASATANTVVDSPAVESSVEESAIEAVSSQPVEENTSSLSEVTEDALVFTFSADCWVEVTDASGKKIFAAVQTSEDILELTGQAPFEVMLGNARAASIVLNGKGVQFTPRPGSKTLRFNITQ